MPVAVEKLTQLHGIVHAKVCKTLEVDSVLLKMFKDWNLKTQRIESLIPLQLGTMYGIQESDSILVASAIISSAFGLRLINDGIDKASSSLFIRSSYPTVLFIKGQSYIHEINCDASKKLALLNYYLKTIELIMESEFNYLSLKSPNYGRFLELVEGRTVSAYLFVFTVFKFLSEDFRKDQEEWESIGYHFGMMIQLRNDFNGLFLAEEYNDLNYNRYSWPIQLALKSEQPESFKLLALLKQKASNSRNTEIKQILWDLGIPSQMSQLVRQHHKVAKNKLHHLSLSKDVSFFEELLMHSMKDNDQLFNQKNILYSEKSSGFEGSPSMQIRHLLRI